MKKLFLLISFLAATVSAYAHSDASGTDHIHSADKVKVEDAEKSCCGGCGKSDKAKEKSEEKSCCGTCAKSSKDKVACQCAESCKQKDGACAKSCTGPCSEKTTCAEDGKSCCGSCGKSTKEKKEAKSEKPKESKASKDIPMPKMACCAAEA